MSSGKKILLAVLSTPAILFVAYVALASIIELPRRIENKMTAAREIRGWESQGAIVIEEGKSKLVNGVQVFFDFLPATQGDLRFTVDGKPVVLPGGVLMVGDKPYRISNAWGIERDAWVALTPKDEG